MPGWSATSQTPSNVAEEVKFTTFYLSKMTGIEFYDFLRRYYTINGQALYDNYSFRQWLLKQDGSFSFQFNGNDPVKSVPKNWLVDSKNARNAGEHIDRDWFNAFYNSNNNNDCRASIAIWLLENHDG